MRFLSLFLCCAIVVCSLFFFVPSASAVGIDYNDYVTSVVVDGDNDRVTVSLPLDQFFWRVSWGDQYVDYEGISFSHTYYAENNYFLSCNSPQIDVSQIPDGTQIYLTYDITELRGMGGYNTPQPYGNIYYSNGESASVALDKTETQYGIFEFTHVLEYNNSSFFFTSVGLNDFSPLPDFTGATAICTLRSCIMEFSISSLLRLQQTTGKTNKILQAVEDAINNPANPEAPQGDSIIQDSIDNENALLNDAKDNWEHAEIIFDSAQTGLTFYAPTFLAVSAMIDSFVGIPFVQTMLQVSLSLGIVAVILSIALNPKNLNRGDSAKGKGGKH